ncbi:MAG: hypothetical protein EZS28_031800 [Streblomastix strix]|uniref:Uncharacterized protein n=1 Tax=Streblomastix strix TaxID=222440 RepID=A0A5J4UQS6_9EUKA|nr:MAG: hypothetical protein EZS28_031800 [Streblomastix strix]
MQTINNVGFSNVCYKQNLIGAPVLWGQNMLSQTGLMGMNRSFVFKLVVIYSMIQCVQNGDLQLDYDNSTRINRHQLA